MVSIPDAVSASQQGVFSFLTKPFDGQELMRRVSDAIRLSPVLDPTHETAQWRCNLLTASVRMDDVLRQALRISEEDRSALIIGPSGSGKTTLARAIHQAAKRAASPFVTLDSTDYPASELESVLQPDAENSVFSQAKKGLLYIRDVATLTPLAQSRLFSVLFSQQQARDPLHRMTGQGLRR